MPPIPLRPVSGRYRGRLDPFEIELRIDIDGPRPTYRVSADYAYAGTGEARGSLRVDRPHVTTTASQIVITGMATTAPATEPRQLTITIPRPRTGDPPPPATLRHFTLDGQAAGASCECAFESPLFRTVLLEEAVQSGVTKFESYDTRALASSGPARTLSYLGAFAEAGIELRPTATPAFVDTTAAGADQTWSDAELHAAMEQKFTLWSDRRQWAVWLFHATLHDGYGVDGPHDGYMLGIMFDRQGAQRQGCAIFYDRLRGTTAPTLRNQLYTCVHELAHTFNLPHAWQRSSTTPPLPSRPGAASWMNYPLRFPGGDSAFWRAFGFQFDDVELVHLRHGFRDEVVMGGDPFLGGAALQGAPDQYPLRAHTGSGLRLSLTMPPSFAYGVPVTADLALSATAPEGRQVATVLGPRSESASIMITEVGGAAQTFEPLLEHCRAASTVLLRPGDPPIRDSAFLHYGKDGYPFREPGVYDVQAGYHAADGSLARSNVVRIRIDPPRSATERAVGRLVYGEPQTGALLSLMGSDAPALSGGNRALQQIIDEVPGHPMAAIARLVRGANAGRAFKTISAQGPGSVRPAQPGLALAFVDPVIDVARLYSAAAAASRNGGGGRRAVAAALAQVGTRPGVDPAVAAFLRTRLGEFATVLPMIASASPVRAVEQLPPLPPEVIVDITPEVSTEIATVRGTPVPGKPRPRGGAGGASAA